MPELGRIVPKLRSKNAGPFWLTIDIFCGAPAVFDRVRAGLSTERVAALFQVPPETIKRFDIASLDVIKFSLPRPQIQGSVTDRDMHGASWAALLAEVSIN
ncbi:MAG: hypothetical protein ACJA1F_002647 [Paracoccaceae bacterium]|jgi:hypothetical protein|tara:strand:+ start:411 stop:713 length:303 start_codon:yes stop_codon:yes gene_type:complete